ncbi:hypothetical protein IKW75_01630 [Candidatus Saccharibacteria bacterium]|nr:hypothetical protein [Candidatus Saccharibacteria bacterium]
MRDFFEKVLEKIKKEYRETLKNFGVKVKEEPTMITEQSKVYEVSLVPEVKRKMIQAMKFRNVMLFVCIVLASVSVGTILIMVSIWSGQNVTMGGQDARLKSMSDKINNYSSLSEFLTIQDQLGNISQINENKKVLSRVFSILSTILPEGPDTVSLSELSVDLSTNTLRFDAQADAKVSPYIDYRVLESFKKGLSLMKYDYGRYVDENGEEIPTMCIVETDENGNTLVDVEESGLTSNKYIYAYWLKGKKGCDPTRDDTEEEEDEEESVEDVIKEIAENNGADLTEEERDMAAEYEKKTKDLNDYAKSLFSQQIESGISIEQAEVIKVYRSPRFSDWYNAGHMDESGFISGVPHFASDCIAYSGADSGGVMKWTSTNECMLISEDPVIQDSSNGRDSAGSLVLRFNAAITLDPQVFMFTNKHVMAISPSGQNVTDSYRQIEGMFAERAADCADSDVVCTATSTGEDN